jgi:hypothetical protein
LGTDNAPKIFPADKLQAPNREALAVSELRFYVGYVTNAWRNMAHEIRVTINIGRWKICEDFPLWAMSPIRSRVMTDNTSVGVGGYFGHRIKLRRPFFIPPGTAIVAYAKRVPDANAGTPYPSSSVPLYLTAVARVVQSDFPRTTNVPYLASYCPTSKLQVGVGTGGTFISGVGDLKNEADQDVEVEHLVGKLGASEIIAAVPQYCTFNDRYEAGFSAPMRLSYDGYEIAPEGTDFAAVFDPNTRSLPMARMVLEQGKRLMFSMPVPYSSAGTFYWMPTLGFLASRKEVLP